MPIYVSHDDMKRPLKGKSCIHKVDTSTVLPIGLNSKLNFMTSSDMTL